MSKARNIADLLNSSGDVKLASLDNAPAPTKSTVDALGIAATSVTGAQASAITANTAKVTYPSADSSKLSGVESGATADQTKADIDGLGIAATSVTGAQASAITANTAKVTNAPDGTKLPLSGGTLSGNLTVNGAISTGGLVVSGELDLTAAGINYIDYSDSLYIRAAGSSPAHEQSIYCVKDGHVSLSYNGVSKLATNNTGVSVIGTVAATAVTGSGSGLTNVNKVTSATGGTITTTGGFKIHKFTSSGTFTAASAGVVEVLIVGGGGGSANASGGGGGGGILHNTSKLIAGGSYTVTVGAGGGNGSNGGSSSFGTMTGWGGGHGQSGVGGSGGGAGHQNPSVPIGGQPSQASGDGIGHGHRGGGHTYSNPYPSGGGGGAGSAGEIRTAGDGKVFNVSGSNVFYSGGGGGGYWVSSSSNAGGSGSGGATGSNGTVNTGGGGGGSATNGSTIGQGASGIVIVRYVV